MPSENPPIIIAKLPGSPATASKQGEGPSSPAKRVTKKSAPLAVLPASATQTSGMALIHNAEMPALKIVVPAIDTKHVPDHSSSQTHTLPEHKTVLPQPSLTMVKSMPETTLSSPSKGFDSLAAFGKANLEAVVLSNQILTKGLEELSKEVMSISQSSVETATSAAKAIWSARSLQDFMEMNADYTKSAIEKFMSNSTKLTELSVKVAADALGPVTARVQKAVETAIKPEIAA